MHRRIAAAGVCLLLAGLVLAQELSEPQAHEPSDIDWSSFPEDVQKTKKLFDERVLAAKEEYDAVVAKARKPLVEALESAQKEATKKGNLDSAIALREAKLQVEAGHSRPDRSAISELMIGRWKVVDGTNPWVFKFKENGRVSLYDMAGTLDNHGGRWRVTDEGVIVTWSLDIRGDVLPGVRFWQLLRYPINTRMTKGDSWAGPGAVKAMKLKR
jgi:hypothetical protein